MLMCVLGSCKKTGFEKQTLDSLHIDLLGPNIDIAHYILYSITLDINELFVVWYF